MLHKYFNIKQKYRNKVIEKCNLQKELNVDVTVAMLIY